MEKSLEHFRELFGLEEPDIRTYSPLTLAYIGDASLRAGDPYPFSGKRKYPGE